MTAENILLWVTSGALFGASVACVAIWLDIRRDRRASQKRINRRLEGR